MLENYTEVAGSVIRNDSGEILLIHRNTPRMIQWELPGGKVDKEESFEEAAIRETAEEIGVDIRLIKKIGSATFTENGKHWRYHWYEAEIVTGTAEVLEHDKFDGIGYFDITSTYIDEADFSINIINLAKCIKTLNS